METKNNPSIKDATLLDNFAGKAMQGIVISTFTSEQCARAMGKEGNKILNTIADMSYNIAEAMIKEKTKHNKD